MNFNFTTKEQYIAQVAEYKAEYAALAQKLRSLKMEIREGMRASKPVYAEQWEMLRSVKAANTLIEARLASKIEAKRQYLAAKI